MLGVIEVGAVLLGVGVGVVSAASPAPLPLSVAGLYPTPAPAGWKHLDLSAEGSVLSYPPALGQVAGTGSVTVALRDGGGNALLSVSVSPHQFELNMSPPGEQQRLGWPAARLSQLRATGATSVHEDARSVSGPFRGGIGACVMDDYVSHVKSIPYREIACLVQGTTDSVIVASTQVSAWGQYGPDLEHVISAYRIT